METFEFYERMKPHIERAAEVARRRASSVITNAHLLWMVYQNEKLRLHFATWDFKNNEKVKPSRHLDEMTREEFEQYLLNLGVWVEEHDDEEKN
jgi:predicted metal-dependent phosphoesterase TrpH